MRLFRVITLTAMLCVQASVFQGVRAQTCSWAVMTDSVALTLLPDSTINLQMRFCIPSGTVGTGEVAVVTPRLVTPTHTAEFPAIMVYGTRAYYQTVRDGENKAPIDNLQYRSREVTAFTPYRKAIRWEPWMREATLQLVSGCGMSTAATRDVSSILAPVETYHKSETAGKHYESTEHLQGTAYITFTVNRTDIEPDLRNNRTELARLHATIDSLGNSPGLQLQHIFIAGYASPEGAYILNDQLARDRTESLRTYIATQWGIDASLITATHEAEDWEGLRRHVEKSQLPDRQQLLDIIDSKGDPDIRLATIAARYPVTYKWLLDNVFPLLRHTDYRIDYTRKTVTDIAGSTRTDTLRQLPIATADGLTGGTPEITAKRFRTYQPVIAVKTNLLFDALCAPNIALELPLGRQCNWSIMAEYINPWWRWDRKDMSYEIQAGVLELRRWFAPRYSEGRPCLSGHFLALYAGGGKYDLERKGNGNQGEAFSTGLTYGYSWPIGRRWNLEASISAGILTGKRRHYHAEFESTHLIYKYTKNLFYAGPTNLRLSLVWILGPDKTARSF